MQVHTGKTSKVTHSLFCPGGTHQFKIRNAIEKDEDVISAEWLLECNREQSLVHLKPHHYIHISKATLKAVPDVDKFGDL